LNRIATAAVAVALLGAPVFAAPDVPDAAKQVKAKVSNIVTLQVSGMT